MGAAGSAGRLTERGWGRALEELRGEMGKGGSGLSQRREAQAEASQPEPGGDSGDQPGALQSEAEFLLWETRFCFLGFERPEWVHIVESDLYGESTGCRC